MTPAIEQLLASYHDWLKGRITVADVGGGYEITTPFLDRHNDRLQIYVEQDGDGYRLSDDSYIISDLAASGCPLDTAHRKKLLDSITRGLGVSVQGDELAVSATRDDFPRKTHVLLQAMLAVNDLFMTSKKHVTNLFLEDVAAFLDEHGIRYTAAPVFTGKSGFHHHFDYVIPASLALPERLIWAINTPSRSEATVKMFAWTDTKAVRQPKTMAFALVNDEVQQPSKDFAKSLTTYGIQVIPWSQRQGYVAELAA